MGRSIYKHEKEFRIGLIYFPDITNTQIVAINERICNAVISGVR